MREVTECMVYHNLAKEELLSDMLYLMKKLRKGSLKEEKGRELYFSLIHRLVEMTSDYGFYGNLWHAYLTFLLLNDENAFSLSCEVVGQVEGSINALAKEDFSIFREYFDFDFIDLDCFFNTKAGRIISNYQGNKSKIFNARIRDRICDLSKILAETASDEDFMQAMISFYKEVGVGKLGLHKAFRIEKDEKNKASIVPITNIAHVHLDDLVGYEIAKKKLIENTEAFVNKRKANNCLLFGDAGTGKSSSIKAILNQYYSQGLRVIEVYKHQFQDLNHVIGQIKNRNYRFIIYMDDLSFEEFEVEYKYLKAVIEGGLEKKPENVLIYATSNRRHLIKETFADKEGRRDQLHASDTVQEKLSLGARFGVTIFFSSPSKKEFQEIVKELARKNKIDLPLEELYMQANAWELSHGGLSGRTAQQFIDYLSGKTRS